MSSQKCPKCFALNPLDSELCSRCGAVLGDAGQRGFMPEMVVGRYRLIRRVGEGGMGEVWEAVHTAFEKTIALKFLHAELLRHPTARRRVLGEAKSLGKITHRNVVTIHDFFETEDTVALALEFVQGGSLADRVESEGAIPWAEAVTTMDGILRGLDALHRAGLVHRDMKPDNVLMALDEDGDAIPKITDLGIAHDQEGTRLTREGSQLGTFEYMAPELFESQSPSVGSDIYACGVLFFELLVGDLPFTGSQAQVMRGHCMESPDLSRIPADVPDHIRQVLQNALAKQPEARFADCKAFRAALQNEKYVDPSQAPAEIPAEPPPSLDSSTLATSTPSAPSASSNSGSRWGMVLGLVFLAGLAAFLVVDFGGPEEGAKEDRSSEKTTVSSTKDKGAQGTGPQKSSPPTPSKTIVSSPLTPPPSPKMNVPVANPPTMAPMPTPVARPTAYPGGHSAKNTALPPPSPAPVVTPKPVVKPKVVPAAPMKDPPMGVYCAHISANDHITPKSRRRLKTAIHRVVQDRASVHRFDLADPGDQTDRFFDSAKKRRRFAQLLGKRDAFDRGAKAAIERGPTHIRVRVWSNRVQVSIVPPGSCP